MKAQFFITLVGLFCLVCTTLAQDTNSTDAAVAVPAIAQNDDVKPAETAEVAAANQKVDQQTLEKDRAKEKLDDGGESINKAAGDIGEAASNAAEATKDKAAEIGSDAADSVKSGADKLKSGADDAKDKFQNAAVGSQLGVTALVSALAMLLFTRL